MLTEAANNSVKMTFDDALHKGFWLPVYNFAYKQVDATDIFT